VKKIPIRLKFSKASLIELDVYYYTVCQGFGHYITLVSPQASIRNYIEQIFFMFFKSDSLAAQFQPLLQASLSTILLHQQKPSRFEESVMCTAVFVLIMCFLRLTFLITKLPKKWTPDIFLLMSKFCHNL
jgi:hypothetical protein